jgi:hypothetical protein
MSFRLLQALSPQLLADSTMSDFMGTSSSSNDRKGKQAKAPKPVLAPIGEDMDARLRSIRRYIAPKELAALLDCDVTTVYRMIKLGMPADWSVGPHGRGRSRKIYPPQVADWLRECREAWELLDQPVCSSPSSNGKHHESDNNAELTSDAELNGHSPHHCKSTAKDPGLQGRDRMAARNATDTGHLQTHGALSG